MNFVMFVAYVYDLNCAYDLLMVVVVGMIEIVHRYRNLMLTLIFAHDVDLTDFYDHEYDFEMNSLMLKVAGLAMAVEECRLYAVVGKLLLL